jgi:hypothetical protein
MSCGLTLQSLKLHRQVAPRSSEGSLHGWIAGMARTGVGRGSSRFRKGPLLGQILPTLSQIGQQPAHRRGPAGAAWVELTDPVAGEAQLALEQLLVAQRESSG